MLRTYFKIALRNILKNKVSISINIGGLTLGITSCLVIFLLADFELNHDTFHEDGDRIYRVVSTRQSHGTQSAMGYVPSPLPARLKQQIAGLEEVAGFYNYYAKITIPKSGNESLGFPIPEREKPSPIIVAQSDYFSIFHYTWLVGDKENALSEPFKVVISDQEAHRYFGNESLEKIIGKEIIYNDSLHLTVSGIVQAWDKNSDFNFSNFISFATVEHSFLKEDIDLKNWGTWDFYSQAFVKLGKNVSPQKIEAQFPTFVKDNFRIDETMKVDLKLQPLADIHFNASYPDAYSRKVSRSTLYGLLLIAFFILVIAAINYINLSTAQAIQRTKEVGIRKVLGSTRMRLILQFLSETSIITLAAVVLSIVLLFPVLSLFKSFLPGGINESPFQWSVGLFFPGIFVITSLLAGLYPAKTLSGAQPVASLKGGDISGQHKSHYRKGLIVFQFTLSLLFIIATLVVGKQIHYILNKDLGFAKDAIIAVKIPSGKNDLTTKKLFVEQLRQLPAVTQASLHRETPLAVRHGSTTIKRVATDTPDITAFFEFTDENYVPLYEIKLLAGRPLSASDTLKEFLINAVCAKELGFRTPTDALGQQVQVGIAGKKGPIVGVVHDFHAQSLHEAIKPFFFTTNAGAARTVSIKINKSVSDFSNVLTDVKTIRSHLYPDEPFEYSFFDDTIASFYATEQKTAQLINLAMFIAIFISCIGLYGLSAFIALQRTKEIGIRKVLGASIVQITSLFSQDFVKLAVLALFIATPIAHYFMTEWLIKYPYRTEINWWIYALAGIIAVIITMLTISYQSIRIALTNPVKSLRA